MIPKGVREIGDRAFYGCTGLTRVMIPKGVRKIGDWAFYGCTGLTSVMIPKDIEIGKCAFMNTPWGLRKQTINSVTVGFSAFILVFALLTLLMWRLNRHFVKQKTKVFGVVALASVGGMALMWLALCLALLFEWSWLRNVNLWLAADVGLCAAYVGLCAAYVVLLTSKIRNDFVIWGVVGCGLFVLSGLFDVLRPVIKGWQWLLWMFSPVGLTGYVFVAISILRFPKTVHPGAKVVGLIGLGYVVLHELAWIVLRVVGATTSSFPKQFYEILCQLYLWPRAIAYALFAVPFAALLFSSKTGVGVGDVAMCANQTRVRR